MLRSHILKAAGSGDPTAHVNKATSTSNDGSLSISGSFEAGDVLLFTVVVSLENTYKSYTPASTATVDSNNATLVFADSKTGLTDDRYMQTFRYTVPSSASSLSIVWTGLTESEITDASNDIQLSKAGAVVRNADPIPYATNNFVIEASDTKTINEKNNGYLYSIYSSFADNGRGDSWSPTVPSGSSSLIGVLGNERVFGNYWTERSTGTASFEYTEPTSEPHYLIGHLISLEPA